MSKSIPTMAILAGLSTLGSAQASPDRITPLDDYETLGVLACSHKPDVEILAYKDMAMAALRRIRPQPELKLTEEEQQRLRALDETSPTEYDVVHWEAMSLGRDVCHLVVDLPRPEVFPDAGVSGFRTLQSHQDKSVTITTHHLAYHLACADSVENANRLAVQGLTERMNTDHFFVASPVLAMEDTKPFCSVAIESPAK